MFNKIAFALLASAVILITSCSTPHSPAIVDAASADMSAERLKNIDNLLQSSIDSNWINNAVAYIAREGKPVYYKAFGLSDAENKVPMEKDAIFRIASQTKAITSVAVMMLFEEGKFLLDDPVSKYIPEFANPTVLLQYNPADTTYTTLPAEREITIRDLLTHTSGIDYAKIGSPTMTAIYDKADIPVGFEQRPLLLGDAMKRLASQPLAHQPGIKFTYGLNSDLLGYLVEVISGMPLDQFLKQRIFEPLNMNDTYFYLPAEKKARLVPVYTEDASKNLVKLTTESFGGLNPGYPLASGTYFSGGAGLSSTILDYAAFLQMLLDGGKYKGKRLLAERTVELMISNQIGDINLGTNKFGLGFEITTQAGEAKLGVTEGSFAWGGFFGTTYWADPEENLVCLLFCQQYPISRGEISDKFRVLVYAALDE